MNVADLVGVPFKVHGRSKEEGFDCYGLVLEVERRAGKNLPDPFYETVDPESNRKVMDLLENGVPAERLDAPERYCVVKMNSGSRPHCGVYLGEGNVIHATENCGVVVQKLHRLKTDGFYRV